MFIVFRLLKSLGYFFILIAVFGLVAFSLWKIFSVKKHFSHEDNQIFIDKNQQFRWEKNIFFLPKSFLLQSDYSSYREGDRYEILQKIETDSQMQTCYFGSFTLLSKGINQLKLYNKSLQKKSVLQQYALLKEKKVMFDFVDAKKMKEMPHFSPCFNWVFLENRNLNLKNEQNKKLIQKKKLHLFRNQCVTLPSHKFFKISSLNSEAVWIQQIDFNGKIQACGRNEGLSFVEFLPLDGSPLFSMAFEVQEKSIKRKERKIKRHLPKDSSGKIFPGWV